MNILSIFKRERSFYKTLAVLALPLVLQNLINSSLALVSNIMVGTLGQNELAGVAIANTPFFIAMLFIFGIQSGGAVLISQYWGKKDVVTINRIMGISFYCAGAVSFLFATGIFLFPHFIMGLVTNNVDLLTIAVRFGRIIAYSYFLNSLVMVYIGTQRSTENPKFGMYVLIVSMLTNTFLNWVLIFGKFGLPALGVEGSALAMLIARIIEFIITIIYIVFFDKHLKFIPRAILMPGKAILKDFVKYSTPVVLNETFWGFGISLLPVIYGHMSGSADIIAGNSIAGNVERIMTVFTFGVANATAIIVGKSIGLGSSKAEVQRLGGDLLGISVLIGAVTGLLLGILTFVVIEPYVFPLFNLSSNAQRIAKTMLLCMSAILFIRAFNATNIVGILRGGGDVKVCMYLDVIPLYIYTVPVAAITALILKWDIQWVYILVMSEEIIKLAFGFNRYHSRLWINNITREF